MGKISKPIRCSPELREIINFIRAKHIMAGHPPPRTSTITKIIAKKIDKEELLRNEFIKF